MPAALLPEDQWEAVKIANIRGVQDEDLAIQFSITETAIRKRRSRDPVWQAAVSDRTHYKVVEAKVAKAEERALSQNDQKGVTIADSEAISASVSSNLAQIAERHPLRMASFLEKKLSRAIESDTLPDIRSWKEANTADTMLRRAIGLDRPAVAVQINNWSGPTSGGWEDEVGHSGAIPDAAIENEADQDGSDC